MNILVVGVGNAGANALKRLGRSAGGADDLAAVNTDAAGLSLAPTQRRILIGQGTVRGTGAGGNPEAGRRAAVESEAELRALMAGRDAVVLIAGLGGGTGSGAIAEVARFARADSTAVVALASTPFPFEGRNRGRIAEDALRALQAEADVVLAFPNESLQPPVAMRGSMAEAFGQVEQLVVELYDALRGLQGPYNVSAIQTAAAAVASTQAIPVDVLPASRAPRPLGLAPALAAAEPGPDALAPTFRDPHASDGP